MRAVLVVLIFIVLPVYAVKKCSSGIEEKKIEAKAAEKVRKEEGDKTSAWVMAKQFVEDTLASPGTADYGSLLKGTFQNPKDHVRSLGDKEYLVEGWVDAQNRYGAVVRSDFKVKLKYMGGDKWNLLEPVELRPR
jgi:hypothetical protein